MTDNAALRAIRNGDETALSSLIDRYTAYIGTVIYNIIGQSMTREDIEESTSDVFLTLWVNADKPQSNKLKEWLGAVARNKAKNKLRELRGSLSLEEDYIDEVSENPVIIITEDEERQVVYQAVKNMKQPDREIFLRHYYGIQTIKRISTDMGMSESAIKVRLSRGREKLRNSIAERR